METQHAFFGHYNAGIWSATMFWTFMIYVTYKFHKAPNVANGFKWRFFFNDNIGDLLLNLFISALLLRAGDKVIHAVYNFINDKFLSGTGLNLSPDGLDVVVILMIVNLPLSYLAHKYLRTPVSKKMEEKMHVHNENCKH